MQSIYSYAKIIVAAALLAFLLFGTAGAMHFGMGMKDGQMPGCPFSGEGAICTMNPLEHLAAWQSAFTTTVPEKNLLSLLLLLLLSLFAVQIWKKIVLCSTDPLPISRVRFREGVFYFDPLREAFSNGILNPKLY